MLHTVYIILLFTFLGVTSALLIATVTTRIRLRHVRMQWPTGVLFGFPLGPSAFMSVIALSLVFIALERPPGEAIVPLGYLVGGSFWLLAVRLGKATVITDTTIYRTLNDTSTSLAWITIVDYAVQETPKEDRYVFFYRNGRGLRLRYELRVPKAKSAAFREVVDERLANRFMYEPATPSGKQRQI
ncbi:MAG: hypothetical protein RhofKO_12220 [Rhodothermales bacterium]